MQVLRPLDIRNANKKTVLYWLFRSEGLSQADLVRLTGLRPPSIFRIFRDLHEAQLIMPVSDPGPETEPEPGRRGRKGNFYMTDARAAHAIGIDFWAHSAALTLIDFRDRALYTTQMDLDPSMSPDRVLSALNNLVQQSLDHCQVAHETLVGIGVGAPGRVDVDNGRILYYSSFEGMSEYGLKSEFEKLAHVPVIVHNNASVIASSEARYGRGVGRDSIITIAIRSGIGGALVSGGEVFVNQNRTTLEIGHTSVDMHGRTCSCGARGCIEAYVTEEAILRDLHDVCDIERFSEVDGLIEAGDARALAVLQGKADVLAVGMRNLFELFNPDRFVIVTRSAALSQLLATRSSAALSWDSVMFDGRVDIIGDTYEPQMAARGAADLVWSAYFQT